ncbi:MAG: type II and III secretion system protein family protein [Gammaproteobacteria bacterium]|nr:MAG: type II and III secretion system protein family protein [Gammaproteobacteria bacterium]RLA51551.1 MAG: type II and III secretion system protein family protein [Gammaproteobacteria bacterium]
MDKKLSLACLTTVLISLLSVGLNSAQAKSAVIEVSQPARTNIQVPLFKSRIVSLSTPVKRVSVGNPDIGDILIIGTKQVYIVGKSLGTTNVVLWDRNDRVIRTLGLEVTHDLETLKIKLHELLPGQVIKVHSSNNSIVLSGEVTSVVKVDAAVKLAESFLKKSKESDSTMQGQVMNMLQVGGAQQVMLQVQVAEISHTLLKRLDMQFKAFHNGSDLKLGAVNGGASFPDARFLGAGGGRLPIFADGPDLVGPMVGEFAPGLHSIADKGLFASYKSGDFLFSLAIDAAKNEGLAKILAEPTLTTLTGQEATVLSGGEFPIPVAQELGQTTIEYKEFGVALKFLPVVLDSGTISLKVNVSVSELAGGGGLVLGVPTAGTDGSVIAGQFAIPALIKRSATSSVELKSGQTMGIAGIIDEKLRENVDKFPGLGDLPLLGPLFRSQNFVKGQTELVIFVTPRLARPITPEEVRLPTDYFVEPSDMEFYLMGKLEGRSKDPEEIMPAGGGVEGQFGHGL